MLSTGFSFFYWKHFGDENQKRRIQHYRNRNDYGGFTQFELFIEKSKFSDLKQEILKQIMRLVFKNIMKF